MSPRTATSTKKPPPVAERDRWEVEATGEAVSDEAIEALARLLLGRLDRERVEEPRK